jgi:hypothetical protein
MTLYTKPRVYSFGCLVRLIQETPRTLTRDMGSFGLLVDYVRQCFSEQLVAKDWRAARRCKVNVSSRTYPGKGNGSSTGESYVPDYRTDNPLAVYQA